MPTIWKVLRNSEWVGDVKNQTLDDNRSIKSIPFFYEGVWISFKTTKFDFNILL